MPRRDDVHKILIIGSGPIVIGQACEFDYSGTQACKALRDDGYQVVLVNSNPATIMTDPDLADRTYVEPLTPDILARIIERERPDALLPTVGGQTALNLAVKLGESGVLDACGVRLLGARLPSIQVCEDRLLFKQTMERIGLDVPRSGLAGTRAEAEEILAAVSFPAIIRPSFTLGGSGGGIAYNIEEFREIVDRGLDLSPVRQVLVEESVLGWKEYELEVMRDRKDNLVVVCSIENFDAMGVHTGDSITVAPAQTLTDKEYQRMRDAARSILRAVGVETGGANVQFAVDPATGRMVVIEMNPRVSRSSALASKATGFPIAKIAARLAVGYTLDEIPNDITRETPSSFEPTIDYVVVKIPRWAFEKFPRADATLGVQMKSVGEAMAIGRTFKEALQKGIRSLEIGRHGLGSDGAAGVDAARVRERLTMPNWERIFYIRYALQAGMSIDAVSDLTKVDRWFVKNIEQIVALEGQLRAFHLASLPQELLVRAKRWGFSDRQLAHLLGSGESEVRAARAARGVRPVFKRVDTCGAEFEAHTPYLYSTYEEECEAAPTAARKVLILGGGPNRIGQGIEFDYCCCHASFALREEGYETIMVNCNPETVSTDYDTSSRLYFEPLTFEDVMNIVEVERPEGVIVQFGGQTPLNLALPLQAAGVPILGTSPDSIDLAEDRKRFGQLVARLGIAQPESGTATGLEEAAAIARSIGYPVLLRPSYVLGGRAMCIAHDEGSLLDYMRRAVAASPDHPILIDRFLEDAFEFDVDAIGDGTRIVIGGVMQHIEEAGIHSGDSACVLPAYKISPENAARIREMTRQLGMALGVRGLMNVQFAIKDERLYVLEVNPRASRTVPFVSKSIGVPLARLAAKVMAGRTLEELGFTEERPLRGWFVKEAVLPFIKFPGEDPVLGPEMRSTGEVMGIAPSFGHAFAKAQSGSGCPLPLSGTVFISVNDYDKDNVVPIATELSNLGFRLVATRGTAAHLQARGVAADPVFKVNEGRPNVVDHIKNGAVALIINTPLGRGSYFDEPSIRKSATLHGVPCITTLSAAAAAVAGIRAVRDEAITVKSLQEYHAGGVAPAPSPA
ncbi:MAG TPA: carbamoyl-phosphate synthase large subunit [Candidatus Polarisedimenticolia bacterium]|nr:carbamoyl-phosphate synthase large subunit [Candidatus Polarisedimenticolia bacterium]